MMLRCAARAMGGMVLLSGVAAGLALTAGTVGAVLLGKRLWEERKGWREGADHADAPHAEPGEPAAEAPSA
jgi:hypothetical protein